MAGSQAAWGIDVGITSLKAIRLRRDGDRVNVEAFDVVEHEKFLSEPDVNRDEIIRHSLQKFIERNPIRSETVFIGVPGSSTFARFVKLPPVEPKKVPEIVRFEAIQQIPFPLDQVNWDYQTFQSPDSPEVEVGIFAMKKDLVAQILSNFKAVGMTVKGVQMSPLAVYNAAAFDGFTDGKGSVLIDMGAEHTDLVILDQGRLWLRTINIGGNHFTDALAKSFKQPFSRAETLKKTAATSKYQKQIFQAMRPIFADLVSEIQRSIGHYNSSHRDSQLERIIGMGNPFRLPNLQKYLQQELKMEVIRLDGFRKANADGRVAAGLNENILGMTAAYGLASQGLGQAAIDTNLLPVEIARQMMWKNKQPWFIGAAALIVLSVSAVFAQYWLANSAFASPEMEEARTKDNQAINTFKNLKSKYDAIPKTYEADKAMVASAAKLADYRTLWPMLTVDIYNSVPQAAKDAKADGPQIVVTSVDSFYTGTLSAFNTSSGSLAAPGVTAPVGGLGAGPVVRGDDEVLNTPVAVAPTTPGAPAPGMVGPSDRGFVVTMNGYARTNTPNPDLQAISQIPKMFEDALMDKAQVPPTDATAKDPNSKPYYFSSPYYLGTPITPPDPATLGTGGGNLDTQNAIWGGTSKNSQSLWDAFVPKLVGLKPIAPLPTGANLNSEGGLQPQLGDLGGPIDAFVHDDKGPHYLYGTFRFTFYFKVHIKG